jgi:putative polyhydroxyalkanoate system protein
MSSFCTEVRHQLGRQEAIQRLQAFVEQLRERYQEHVSHLEGDWEDNQLQFGLTTFGMSITGAVTVEDDTARVEGKLPLAAMMFKGKIESAITEELERALA